MKNILTSWPLLFLFLYSSCAKDIDLEFVPAPNLRNWLNNHTNVADQIKLEDDANPSYFFGGSLTETKYSDWNESDKAALDDAFERAWQWLYQTDSLSISGSEEFSMPLECTYCQSRLITHPNNGPFTVIPEDLSKKAYIAFVAHSLALEIGDKLSWSITDDSAAELHHYLNSRSMMHRVGDDGTFFFGEPGGGGDARIKYLGRVSPATPIYSFNWFRKNNLLKSTHEETIYAVLEWFRDNVIHFYGSATYQNMQDHWGYPGQTSAYLLMTGTVRDTESNIEHWTAGCHGTAGFIKSVFKAVNIPVEIIYTCGHSQLYFPTIGRYLDHADNPYNSNVTSNPSKHISNLLLSSSNYALLFSVTPDYLDPSDPLCANIGYTASNF